MAHPDAGPKKARETSSWALEWDFGAGSQKKIWSARSCPPWDVTHLGNSSWLDQPLWVPRNDRFFSVELRVVRVHSAAVRAVSTWRRVNAVPPTRCGDAAPHAGLKWLICPRINARNRRTTLLPKDDTCRSRIPSPHEPHFPARRRCF